MRFDLSDEEWAIIEPLLPLKKRGPARVDVPTQRHNDRWSTNQWVDNERFIIIQCDRVMIIPIIMNDCSFAILRNHHQ